MTWPTYKQQAILSYERQMVLKQPKAGVKGKYHDLVTLQDIYAVGLKL